MPPPGLSSIRRAQPPHASHLAARFDSYMAQISKTSFTSSNEPPQQPQKGVTSNESANKTHASHLRERQRTSRNALSDFIRIDVHFLSSLCIFSPLDPKRPQNARHGQSQRPLGEMHSGTNSPSCTKGPVVISVSDVIGGLRRRLASCCERHVVMPAGIEHAWIREEGRVVVGGPHGQHDPRTRGDMVWCGAAVNLDGVVGAGGVRHRAGDAGGHPAEGLFDDSADIGERIQVFDGWEVGHFVVVRRGRVPNVRLLVPLGKASWP